MKILKHIFFNILLYPVLPLLGWGPITHAYINRRALEFLDDMNAPDDEQSRKAFENSDNRDLFLITAGYPDIIKAKGFLKGDTSYDYAHNPYPNRYYGNPMFAIALLKRFQRLSIEKGVVVALSWRAHQISDVFAHHVPLNGFWGYVNSENFFGPFWPDVLKHLDGKDPMELPGAFYRADHWISELIIDLFCYIKGSPEWTKRILVDTPDDFLPHICEESRDYLNEHKSKLVDEYDSMLPIEHVEVARGEQFSNALNKTTIKYFDSLLKKRSVPKILEMIRNHGKFKYLEQMLDHVAWITAKALVKPNEKWNAPRVNAELFLNGDSNLDDVFPGDITPDDNNHYFSERLENEWKNYKPKREGIVKLVLERTPIAPIQWIVQYTPLITGGGFINRALLPKGKTSYALSLRYAYNIRESNDENLMSILRKTLQEVDVID